MHTFALVGLYERQRREDEAGTVGSRDAPGSQLERSKDFMKAGKRAAMFRRQASLYCKQNGLITTSRGIKNRELRALVKQHGKDAGASQKARIPDEEFFESRAWKELRYRALKMHAAKCQCCGAGRGLDRAIHVDHIKPRSKFPELQWDISNLQVLCEDCNIGKGAWDETDWREKECP